MLPERDSSFRPPATGGCAGREGVSGDDLRNREVRRGISVAKTHGHSEDLALFAIAERARAVDLIGFQRARSERQVRVRAYRAMAPLPHCDAIIPGARFQRCKQLLHFRKLRILSCELLLECINLGQLRGLNCELRCLCRELLLLLLHFVE